MSFSYVVGYFMVSWFRLMSISNNEIFKNKIEGKLGLKLPGDLGCFKEKYNKYLILFENLTFEQLIYQEEDESPLFCYLLFSEKLLSPEKVGILFNKVKSKQGVDWCTKLKNGNSLLHHAFMHREYVAIHAIIESDPETMNVKNSEGLTPLDLINEKAVDKFFEVFSKKTKTGNSCESRRVSEAFFQSIFDRLIRFSECQTTVKKLLKIKSIRVEQWGRALVEAARIGNKSIVESILDVHKEFTKMQKSSEIGASAITEAIRNNHPEVVSSLIKNNVAFDSYYTLVKEAIKSCSDQIMSVVLFTGPYEEKIREIISQDVKGKVKIKKTSLKQITNVNGFLQKCLEKRNIVSYLCSVQKAIKDKEFYFDTSWLSQFGLLDEKASQSICQDILGYIQSLEKACGVQLIYNNFLSDQEIQELICFVRETQDQDEECRNRIISFLEEEATERGIRLVPLSPDSGITLSANSSIGSLGNYAGRNLGDTYMNTEELHKLLDDAFYDGTSELESYFNRYKNQLLDLLTESFKHCCGWHLKSEEKWDALPLIDYILKKAESNYDKCKLITSPLCSAYLLHGSTKCDNPLLTDGVYNSEDFRRVAFSKLQSVRELIGKGSDYNIIDNFLADALISVLQGKHGNAGHKRLCLELFHKDIVENGFEPHKIFSYAITNTICHHKFFLMNCEYFERFCPKNAESVLSSAFSQAVNFGRLRCLTKLVEVMNNLRVDKHKMYGVIFTTLLNRYDDKEFKLLKKVMYLLEKESKDFKLQVFIDACTSAMSRKNNAFCIYLLEQKGTQEFAPVLLERALAIAILKVLPNAIDDLLNAKIKGLKLSNHSELLLYALQLSIQHKSADCMGVVLKKAKELESDDYLNLLLSVLKITINLGASNCIGPLLKEFKDLKLDYNDCKVKDKIMNTFITSIYQENYDLCGEVIAFLLSEQKVSNEMTSLFFESLSKLSDEVLLGIVNSMIEEISSPPSQLEEEALLACLKECFKHNLLQPRHIESVIGFHKMYVKGNSVPFFKEVLIHAIEGNNLLSFSSSLDAILEKIDNSDEVLQLLDATSQATLKAEKHIMHRYLTEKKLEIYPKTYADTQMIEGIQNSQSNVEKTRLTQTEDEIIQLQESGCIIDSKTKEFRKKCEELLVLYKVPDALYDFYLRRVSELFEKFCTKPKNRSPDLGIRELLKECMLEVFEANTLPDYVFVFSKVRSGELKKEGGRTAVSSVKIILSKIQDIFNKLLEDLIPPQVGYISPLQEDCSSCLQNVVVATSNNNISK